MHYTDLVEQVSESSGLPKTKVHLVLQSFVEVAKNELRRGGNVIIPRFGTFFACLLKPRNLFGGTRQVRRESSIHFHESRRA
jgi:nucleoid DNA-binding protein